NRRIQAAFVIRVETVVLGDVRLARYVFARPIGEARILIRYFHERMVQRNVAFGNENARGAYPVVGPGTGCENIIELRRGEEESCGFDQITACHGAETHCKLWPRCYCAFSAVCRYIARIVRQSMPA